MNGINVILIAETFIAFIIAVTIHEAAHAAMAALLGDASPVAAGRLSLSPRRQMAAVGSIVALYFSFAFVGAGVVSGGTLGWGRPVDPDARRLRVGPNFGLILVALAGPVVNVLVGIGVLFGLTAIPGYGRLDTAYNFECFAFRGGEPLQQCMSSAQSPALLRLDQFLFAFAVTSIVLALVNILPLHPLDGYKVLFALLPTGPALRLRSWEPYMELLLLVLFFLLPWLLGWVNIPFDPADWFFIGPARSIAESIASGVGAFYQFL